VAFHAALELLEYSSDRASINWPAATSHAIGSDSQRPFATVIVGGLTTALLLSIYLLPTLYVSPELWARIWGRRQLDKMPQSHKTFYLRCYRTSGVLLCLAGILLAAEKIWAVN